MGCQQSCWLFYLEKLTFLKVFMAGNLGLHFVDLDSLVGWRMGCPLSTNSFMSFLWILIPQARIILQQKKMVMECILLHHHHKVRIFPGQVLSARIMGIQQDGQSSYFHWILFPLKFLLGIPICLSRLFYIRGSTEPSPRRSQQNSRLDTIRKMHTLRDHVIHRTTDRRRGVIEDLHLAIEIFREVIFDFFHRAAYFILSPSEVLKATYRWFLPQTSCSGEIDCDVSDTSISMDNLGGDDPAPIERKNTFHQSLNTDARTCQDVITELGYPYEAIHVITSDGYVLLLERIPRRDSRKAVYLQHGILDSSMGWVPNGIVGSPAFAAYDQGYDVFLGNFRGLVSREHIDKNISSRKYWRYSNDHGTEDIPAMIEKIDQVKTAELKISQPDLEVESNDDQTYRLCAVSHSLGGAAMLMYIIIRRIEEKPHRLSRFFVVTCWLPL